MTSARLPEEIRPALDNGDSGVDGHLLGGRRTERHGHFTGLLRGRDARGALLPVLQQDDQERARESARLGRLAQTTWDRRTGRWIWSSSVRRRKGRSSTRWTCRLRRSRRRPACPAFSSCGPPTFTASFRWRAYRTKRDRKSDTPYHLQQDETNAAPDREIWRRRSPARRRNSRSCSASRPRSTRRSTSRRSTTSRSAPWTSCSSSITR